MKQLAEIAVQKAGRAAAAHSLKGGSEFSEQKYSLHKQEKGKEVLKKTCVFKRIEEQDIGNTKSYDKRYVQLKEKVKGIQEVKTLTWQFFNKVRKNLLKEKQKNPPSPMNKMYFSNTMASTELV